MSDETPTPSWTLEPDDPNYGNNSIPQSEIPLGDQGAVYPMKDTPLSADILSALSMPVENTAEVSSPQYDPEDETQAQQLRYTALQMAMTIEHDSAESLITAAESLRAYLVDGSTPSAAAPAPETGAEGSPVPDTDPTPSGPETSAQEG